MKENMQNSFTFVAFGNVLLPAQPSISLKGLLPLGFTKQKPWARTWSYACDSEEERDTFEEKSCRVISLKC